MNVRNIVKAIHEDIEQSDPARAGSPAPKSSGQSELAALRNAFDRLYSVRHLVGRMPPSPGTLRGRLGRHLVQVVQRMLFWYTPQIHRFQDEAAQTLDGLLRVVELQADMIDVLRKDLTSLRRDLWEQRADTPQGAPSTAGTPGTIPASFEFALQDHFRGSEQNTTTKLSVWLDEITAIANAKRLSEGAWLDIGCGRGEWLALVAKAGIRVTGIDASAAAVAHCREARLTAEHADARSWLEQCPDGSLAVISAFHVVEHMPAEVLLSFVQLAARKLQAGGVLAIETPNPANLTMGAHHFWNDPTHQRPVPASLLRFVMVYFGLKVVKQLELNPCPDAEHLPFAEIDVVRRIDHLMFGPQDYGLIGRRDA